MLSDWSHNHVVAVIFHIGLCLEHPNIGRYEKISYYLCLKDSNYVMKRNSPRPQKCVFRCHVYFVFCFYSHSTLCKVEGVKSSLCAVCFWFTFCCSRFTQHLLYTHSLVSFLYSICKKFIVTEVGKKPQGKGWPWLGSTSRAFCFSFVVGFPTIDFRTFMFSRPFYKTPLNIF